MTKDNRRFPRVCNIFSKPKIANSIMFIVQGLGIAKHSSYHNC